VATLQEKSAQIKAEAKRLGFFACGIAQARYLEEEADNLKNWLDEQKNGEMAYMQNHFDKRLDPRLLVPGAKSVIVLLQAYFPEETQKDTHAPIISKYAYGEDYHIVIKDKLKLLFDYIDKNIEETEGRIFTDSAPVLEKKWAELAGLGWRGKNSNLITKNGSFFFISELILDIELAYDSPTLKNYCGTCTRCIEACPTQAITELFRVDARKCISYLTIEYRGDFANQNPSDFKNRVFGCDICQDVCPYNRKPIIHNESRFLPHPELLRMTLPDWENITPEKFTELFKKSAVKRTKFSGLKRNIDFLLKQNRIKPD